MKREALDFLDLLLSSSNVAVFTGAGISTESGIPDYRSPGTGLWGKMDQSVVSLSGFLQNPGRYYSYALKLHPVRSSAKPNYAHKMLAEFEREGFLKGVITQNVDGLHHKAGSINIHELHGSLRQAVCINCNLMQSMESVMERVVGGENPPICGECSGILKPNAVFFGESLPRVPWEESVSLVNNADLFVSIGSSLQVSPANTLPNIAIKNNAQFVIINIMDTPYDQDASMVIRHKIAEFSKIVLDLYHS